ncbi:hypothetical protein BUALT_Bualt07G0071200 [Buddleja alternifolia]|uniref:NAC domain-containing protein n=1 Tax=Buddleja alternifolia TaxID=168488 RepID=A0AAV6X844_9LAMI|nr:hypothetical protein BUALT_Bualt07G0071200 [Buddleja alternifolia]
MTCMAKVVNRNMDAELPIGDEVPIGYRFRPTDEELMRYYLSDKVFLGSVPSQIIREIDVSQLYAHHPKELVESKCDKSEREQYFFVHHDDYFHGKIKKERSVGDEIGVWRSTGDEVPIYDSRGNIFGFKIHFTYFGCKTKKTHWRMEEYRLINIESRDDEQVMQIEDWVLARITRGTDYSKSY